MPGKLSIEGNFPYYVIIATESMFWNIKFVNICKFLVYTILSLMSGVIIR